MLIMHSQFVLKPGINETDFLTASDKMQDEFYGKHDSLERRELLKTNDNTWIEILHWSNNGPAKHVRDAFWASDTCTAFMGMIKQDSVKASKLKQARVHNGTN